MQRGHAESRVGLRAILRQRRSGVVLEAEGAGSHGGGGEDLQLAEDGGHAGADLCHPVPVEERHQFFRVAPKKRYECNVPASHQMSWRYILNYEFLLNTTMETGSYLMRTASTNKFERYLSSYEDLAGGS